MYDLTSKKCMTYYLGLTGFCQAKKCPEMIEV
jgi:hypothetical protein